MTEFRINSRWLIVAGLLLAGFSVTFTFAAPPESSAERSARAVEIARLRFKLYERVDYPLRQRQLRRDITLMEARVASLRRRIKEAEGFYGSKAVFTTLEVLRLNLLEAELLVKDWKHELTLLQIHNQDERRLRQLLIADAQRQATSR